MDTLFDSLSFVDVFIGLFSFSVGSLATLRKFRSNPYRSMSIFLQVSLLLLKMSKSYYDSHPEAKKKLNAQIAQRLDKISDQLYEYTHGKKEKDELGPVG